MVFHKMPQIQKPLCQNYKRNNLNLTNFNHFDFYKSYVPIKQNR